MKNLFALLVVFGFLAAGNAVQAGGLNTPLNGLTARNVGSGGGFSLFDWQFNPAMALEVELLEARLGMNALYLDFDYDRDPALGGGSFNDANPTLPLPSGGIVWRPADQFTIFASLITPYGQGADFSMIGFDAEIAFVDMAIGASYEITDWWAIGISGKALYVDTMYSLPLFAGPAYLGQTLTEGNGWGYSLQVGTVFKLDPLSLALTYEPGTTVHLRGSTKLPAGMPLAEDNFKSLIHSPDRYGIGLKLDALEDLALGVNYFYTDYSANDVLPVNYENLPTNYLSLGWKAVHAVHVGAEWNANERLTLRTGGAWMSEGTPDTSFPSVPDGAGWAVGAGAGFRLTDHWQFDIGGGYFWADRSISASSTNIGAGTYELEGFVAGAMVAYVW